MLQSGYDHGLDTAAIEVLHRQGAELVEPRAPSASVREAGRELAEFGLSKARDVLAIVSAQDKRLGHMHDLVLAWLSWFSNRTDGFSFPSYELLAELCCCEAKTVRNTCSELATWGYLVRSKGNEIGAHGKKGPSFAVQAGGGQSWATAQARISKALMDASARVKAKHAGKNNGPDYGEDSLTNGPDCGDNNKTDGPDYGAINAFNGPGAGAVEGGQWPHTSGPFYKNLLKEEPEVQSRARIATDFRNSDIAHPVKKSGVSSPRQKERGQGADPGIFAASDPGVFADSNPVLKNPVSEVQSRAARIGTDLLNPGVALPASIQIAIDSGRAKVGARNLVDAIEAALSRGVEAQMIEMALRKSVAAAVRDAGDRDPPASSILSRAIWYVERSDGERIAEPLAPRGPRARMPVKDFDIPDIPDDQLSSINTTWED